MELLSESIVLHLQFCYKCPSRTNIRIRCHLQWHLKFEKTPNRTQTNQNGITKYLHSKRFWTAFKCATYIIACCLKTLILLQFESKVGAEVQHRITNPDSDSLCAPRSVLSLTCLSEAPWDTAQERSFVYLYLQNAFVFIDWLTVENTSQLWA